jgi:hypothetical protein
MRLLSSPCFSVSPCVTTREPPKGFSLNLVFGSSQDSQYSDGLQAARPGFDSRHGYYFFLVSLGGVRLSPLGTSATVGLSYQPRMIDDDYGAVGGMRIDRGNRSTRRKPASVPLCPPQIPHDLTWDRTQAAAVGSQRLTA